MSKRRSLATTGPSQVFLWSSARIGGIPVVALLARRGERMDELRHQLERDLRYANITIKIGRAHV